MLHSSPSNPSKGKSNELMSAAGNKFQLDEKEITPYVAVSVHAGGSMLGEYLELLENPERAMMLINMMHTNEELVNLLVWGIEGVHHEVVQEEPKLVKAVEGNTWTTSILPWTIDNVLLNHWLGGA